MAGASTALPLDAFAAANNPAGIVYVGSRLDMEMELIKLHRQVTISGSPTPATGILPLNPDTYESDSEWFPVPALAWSGQLDDEQSIGLALYGHGGVNTDYVATPNPLCPNAGGGMFCTGTVGIDLAQAFIVPSYAHKFGHDGRFSVGIAPIFAIQRFKARGLSFLAPFSSNTDRLTNQGYDYSYGGGVRVGVLFEPIEGLHFGASYKSRIFMTPFSSYSGLIANEGSLDMPESFNLGLAWNVNDEWTGSFDVEHIRYSTIPELGSPILPNLFVAGLGQSSGAGLGLDDMTVFKWGLQWRPDDNWSWRMGVSYGKQPIPESQVLFNTLTAGVQEIHLTTGLTWSMSSEDEFSFAFMYSPTHAVKGQNVLNPGQTIELEMNQMSFQMAWTRRF